MLVLFFLITISDEDQDPDPVIPQLLIQNEISKFDVAKGGLFQAEVGGG